MQFGSGETLTGIGQAVWKATAVMTRTVPTPDHRIQNTKRINFRNKGIGGNRATRGGGGKSVFNSLSLTKKKERSGGGAKGQ